MTAPTTLRIRLLGGLAVEGLEEHEVGSRKGRTVLKLLAAARGAPVPVDSIADALWPDRLPARPAEQVGVLVSRLRAALGADHLPRTDAGYALVCDWLDLDELDARAAEAEQRLAAGQPVAARTAAEAALSLVRGPVAPDEDGEWADAARRDAERSVARARQVVAEAALALGDHGAALTAAEATLDADPYDEVALRAVMRAHAVAGRPASALAAYTRVRARLAEDLGMPPAADTEAVHDAIVLGDMAPAPEPETRGLPGRDAELASLDAVLAETESGAATAAVVEGEMGIGKTAVLDAAAARAVGRGHLVLRCSCDPLGRDLSLQPVLDGLVAALRAAGPDVASAAMGPDSPVLEPLLGWRPGAAGGSSATVVADAEAGRALLFAALLGTVTRLAGERVVVIVVDDVHLVDAGTAAWLAFAVRRGGRVAVLAARRPEGTFVLPGARLVPLGPLNLAAAEAIVGPERGEALLAKSGGNPLFLVELARSGETLPATVRDAVTARAAALGPGVAETLRTAAALGPDLDLDLLAGVVGRPIAELLGAAEAALAAGLLAEREASYAFAHDLVREALAADLSAARRAFLNREAAHAIAARPDAEPSRVAWYAQHGGDRSLAARALVSAAGQAVARYSYEEAELLLNDAVGLDDTPEVRLARGRVRLSRLDPDGATDDARQALAAGAGAPALEVAGWASYYRRDWAAARRHADEGAARAEDGGVRASCLALAGRSRHAVGDVDGAEPRLVEASESSSLEVRSLARVWLASLRCHEGRPAEALDLASRALIEPHRFGHSFALLHGQFTNCLALGMLGRAGDLLREEAALSELAERLGNHGARFRAVSANMRAWGLRSLGAHSDAVDTTRWAIAHCRALDLGPEIVSEPHHVAFLDLVEELLLVGDIDGAVTALASASVVEAWDGTMAWRSRTRLELSRAALDLATGEAERAAARADATAAQAAGHRNARHRLLAGALGARAAFAAGLPVDHDATDAVIGGLETCAAMEAWRITAALAAAGRVDRWWSAAERQAAVFVAGAGDHGDDARRYVERTFSELRRA